MADTQANFDKAVYYVRNAKAQEDTTENKLKIYGLYKQALNGDCTDAAPWAVQLEAKSKWQAWTDCKGMSKADAMKAYVARVSAKSPGWENSDVVKAMK